MTTIYGQLGIDSSTYIIEHTMGSSVLRDATMEYMNQSMAAMNHALGAFVETTTDTYKERYELPMTGEMDEVAEGAESPPVDVVGYWDVAYPLRQFQNALTGTDVDLAYLTAAQYQNKVDGILTRYQNRNRKDILRALLDNAPGVFADKRWGNLAVVPLANGDGTLYPPAIGSDAVRTLDVYFPTTYATASISNTNNPYATAETHFRTTFGRRTGGIPIYAYINSAERAKTEALTDFVPVVQTGVSQSANQEYLMGFNDIIDPAGEVIGKVGSVVISVWDFVPATYMIFIYGESTAPLKRRIDPSQVGLGGGNLVPVLDRLDDGAFFRNWRARFGFAVGNRMNGYVVQLTTESTYAVPAGFENR